MAGAADDVRNVMGSPEGGDLSGELQRLMSSPAPQRSRPNASATGPTTRDPDLTRQLEGIMADSPRATFAQRFAGGGPEPARPGHGLLNEFMNELRTPESEMYNRHITWGARIKDVPHDVTQEFVSGLETIRSVGQRSEGQGKASGLMQDFLRLVGGTARSMFSPATGPLKSMAGRPIAERVDLSLRTGKPTTEQEFGRRTWGEAFRAATPKGSIEFHEQQPSSEDNTDTITGALTFAMPGMGVIRYRQLGARLADNPVSRAMERIFSPNTVSLDAGDIEAILRGYGGRAARDTEQTSTALQVHSQVVNALPEADRFAFINAVETGATGHLPAPLQQLAGVIRNAMEHRQTALEGLTVSSDMDFIENYFPHMWQDPRRAVDLFRHGSSSKQGSGASLHARSIPTIADGLAAGLVPVTSDPIELVMRYVKSMDKFIAAERTRELMLNNGMTRWVRPQVVGASGHPNSWNVPEGWSALRGRGARRVDGAELYAPDDVARVYNNFVSRGIEGDWQPIYNGVQRTSNAVTALELSMSGYHGLTMTFEAAANRMASAIQKIVGGARDFDWRRVLSGVGQAASHPVAAWGTAVRGRELQHAYLGEPRGPVGQFRGQARAFLGLTPGSPDMARIVGLLERAGGRAVGSRHAEIHATPAANYWQAWRSGAEVFLRAADRADMAAHPAMGTARFAVRSIARAMDTMSHAIFNTYIPRLKNGAFYETMKTWLDNHPQATYPEQVRAARSIVDSIDNRFGEMIQDNIFWHTTMKKVAQLGMRSYSWNMGTFREIGGGARDAMAGPGASSTATAAAHGANRVVDSQRVAYILALPMTMATMSSIFMYLKTGKAPETLDDLLAARTGGTVPGPAVPSMRPGGRSQRNDIAERVMLPGYQKDVFGWYMNPLGEAFNKLNTGIRTPMELIANADWRNLPIVNPEGSIPQWLDGYLKFVEENYGPITLRQKTKQGSTLSRVEQLMGLKEAPAYLTAPEDYAEQKHRLNLRDQKRKENIERRERELYGGTDEE